MKTSYSKQELIKLIQTGGKDLDTGVRWMYSKSGWMNIVRKMIRNMGGSKQDTEDVVQEGLISFILDVQKRKLQSPDGAKAYFIRSCKNIWLNQFNRKIRGEQIIAKEFSHEEEVTDDKKKADQKEFWEQLDQILDQLGRKCKEILKLWSMGYSHVDIAKMVNYESANVSKKTKSICIEKLRSLGLNPNDFYK